MCIIHDLDRGDVIVMFITRDGRDAYYYCYIVAMIDDLVDLVNREMELFTRDSSRFCSTNSFFSSLDMK